MENSDKKIPVGAGKEPTKRPSEDLRLSRMRPGNKPDTCF